MPQMMPLNWLFQFLMFSSIFMMFNIMNYFQPVPTPLSTKISIKPMLISWKW
uniref:ATP synthase F0 subunit 8 n=1 Tax=Margattea bisignata TaxID=1928774 RepID=UPI00279DE651|nr:ATP synthase F0 subunit 8 [Margattea bisignata]WGO57369.1 ATP synthase F0 subunit 8 [Margattea bisignata]